MSSDQEKIKTSLLRTATDFNGMLIIDSQNDYPDDPFCINEPGWLRIWVIQNKVYHEQPWWKRLLGHESRGLRVLEIEYEEYSGCVSWMSEGMGIEYWVKEYIDPNQLIEGTHFEIDGLSVSFTRGDGWTTDDDEEWEWETETIKWNLLTWLPHKLSLIWDRLTLPFRKNEGKS